MAIGDKWLSKPYSNPFSFACQKRSMTWLVKIQLPISFTRAGSTGPLYHGTPEARGHTSYADRECLMYACMYRVCFACVCMGVCVLIDAC